MPMPWLTPPVVTRTSILRPAGHLGTVQLLLPLLPPRPPGAWALPAVRFATPYGNSSRVMSLRGTPTAINNQKKAVRTH